MKLKYDFTNPMRNFSTNVNHDTVVGLATAGNALVVDYLVPPYKNEPVDLGKIPKIVINKSKTKLLYKGVQVAEKVNAKIQNSLTSPVGLPISYLDHIVLQRTVNNWSDDCSFEITRGDNNNPLFVVLYAVRHGHSKFVVPHSGSRLPPEIEQFEVDEKKAQVSKISLGSIEEASLLPECETLELQYSYMDVAKRRIEDVNSPFWVPSSDLTTLPSERRPLAQGLAGGYAAASIETNDLLKEDAIPFFKYFLARDIPYADRSSSGITNPMQTILAERVSQSFKTPLLQSTSMTGFGASQRSGNYSRYITVCLRPKDKVDEEENPLNFVGSTFLNIRYKDPVSLSQHPEWDLNRWRFTLRCVCYYPKIGSMHDNRITVQSVINNPGTALV